MKLLRNIEVPTGNIIVVEGEKGKLECVSLGDYGKDANLKASFLGLDREIERVQHQDILPLEEKWVVTISTQYGCSMGCSFCDVPKVGKGVNATYNDIINQVIEGLRIHPEVTNTKRLNIHYARMGEPTFNDDVIKSAKNMPEVIKPYIGESLIHPVISTMLPKNNKNLLNYLQEWMEVKNEYYNGNAGLQFSINSTNEEERQEMFKGSSITLEEVSEIGKQLQFPKGRKITLNFAVADYEIDAKKLKRLFDTDKFIVKLTPMHKTTTAIENGIKTQGEYTSMYPYIEYEEALKAEGFDVIVFIASEYEDMGRITCGNAILSGSMPLCPYTEKEIK